MKTTTSWWRRGETSTVSAGKETDVARLRGVEPVRVGRELVLDDLDGLPSAFSQSARATSPYEMPGLGWRYG